METREVDAGIFLARGFLGFAGWREAAGLSWKRGLSGVGDEEKSCKN
jgi:hypothetical protein